MIDPVQLLTVGGVAAVVSAIMAFMVKPWLRPQFDPNDAKQEAGYKARMNWIAIALGIILAIGAALVAGQVDGNGLLSAVLTGLFGGITGIGGHQALSNTADGMWRVK